MQVGVESLEASVYVKDVQVEELDHAYEEETKETSIKPRADKLTLSNHELHKFVCAYHPCTGEHQEVLRDTIGEAPLTRGYYVKLERAMIGVYATESGPVVFMDAQRFLLEQGRYQMSVSEAGEAVKEFTLTVDGQEVIRLRYPKPVHLDYDAWSDEETTDFFVWLSADQNTDRFHEFYRL